MAPCSYTDAARVEARILEKLNHADPEGRSYCVRYFGSFTHKRHLCLVFERLGASLCVPRLRGRPPPPGHPFAPSRRPLGFAPTD
jgi:hypothetical protein